MIASYKRKANIAGAIFMATIIGLFVLGRVLAWAGHSPTGEDIDALAVATGIALAVAYFYGTWAYLKAKGRSGAWVLLAGSLIGMIVVLLLKDHAKDGQPPAPRAPPAPQEYFG